MPLEAFFPMSRLRTDAAAVSDAQAKNGIPAEKAAGDALVKSTRGVLKSGATEPVSELSE